MCYNTIRKTREAEKNTHTHTEQTRMKELETSVSRAFEAALKVSNHFTFITEISCVADCRKEYCLSAQTLSVFINEAV